MITWSGFVSHMLANEKSVAPSVWRQIKTEGVARIRERQAAGYGRTPLDFSDLCSRLEDAMAPAAA